MVTITDVTGAIATGAIVASSTITISSTMTMTMNTPTISSTSTMVSGIGVLDSMTVRSKMVITIFEAFMDISMSRVAIIVYPLRR